MLFKHFEIYRKILPFALPIIAEQILVILIDVVNTAYVGNVGTAELSAVALGTTLLSALRAIYNGMSLGAAAKISRLNSQKEGDKEQIRQITSNALYISLVLSSVISVSFYFFRAEICRLLFSSAEREVLELTSRYLEAAIWSSLFIAIDFAASSCLRGAGNSRLPFLSKFISNIVNIVFGYLFIWHFRMGIFGAGLALLVSIASGAICNCICLVLSKSIALKKLKKPRLNIVRHIGIIGIPSCAEKLLIELAFLGIQMVTLMISTEALASYQVVNSFMRFVYSVTTGLEIASVTVVGSYIGAHDVANAKKHAYGVLRMCEEITAVLALLLLIFPELIVSMFSPDPGVVDLAVRLARLLAFSIPITSAFQGVTGTLRTGGCAKTLVISSLFGPWGIRVPVAYILVRFAHLGIYGLVIGMFCDYTFRSILQLSSFLRGKWLYD